MATGKSAELDPCTDLSHERREEFPRQQELLPVPEPHWFLPWLPKHFWHSANFSLGVPRC